MKWLVTITALLMVLDSIIIIFKPQLLKKYCSLFSEGAMIYIAAALKTLVGAILLIGASTCNKPAVLLTVGTLALFAAVFVVFFPQKARKMALFFGSKNNAIIRVIGFVYLAVALLLVYAA